MEMVKVRTSKLEAISHYQINIPKNKTAQQLMTNFNTGLDKSIDPSGEYTVSISEVESGTHIGNNRDSAMSVRVYVYLCDSNDEIIKKFKREGIFGVVCEQIVKDVESFLSKRKQK